MDTSPHLDAPQPAGPPSPAGAAPPWPPAMTGDPGSPGDHSRPAGPPPSGDVAVAPRPRRLTFGDVVLAFVGYLVAAFGVGAALAAIRGPDALESVMLAVTVAGVAPALGAGAVLVARRRPAALLGLTAVSARWWAIGLGVGLLGLLANRIVVLVYVLVTGDTSNPQQGLADASTGDGVTFAILVLAGGLLVPFGEELLFRGVLFGWLRRWGLPVAAGVSAVVFGLFHGFSVVLPAAVLIGVLLAILRERSGSIWPAVAAHALNNTLLFVLARILG